MVEQDYHPRRLARAVILGMLLAGHAACAKTPQVVGEVLDGFGKPLPGVAVAVARTTFAATTDNSGRYAVEYEPGKVTVTITKAGYTSGTLTLDIAAATEHQAQPVTLYQVPDEKGIVAVGASGYVPLSEGTLSHNNFERPPGGSDDTPLSTETYTVSGDFKVLAGTDLVFLDNAGLKQQLFKVDAQGAISERVRQQQFARNRSVVIPVKDVQLAPRVSLRKVTLAPGRYAFSAPPGDPTGVPVYLFEVK